MLKPAVMNLEDLTTAVYCTLDDALKEAGITAKDGKLLGRRGSRRKPSGKRTVPSRRVGIQMAAERAPSGPPAIAPGFWPGPSGGCSDS